MVVLTSFGRVCDLDRGVSETCAVRHSNISKHDQNTNTLTHIRAECIGVGLRYFMWRVDHELEVRLTEMAVWGCFLT